MKRTIGFDNFRRFIHFEPITYDHITYLVGRNNSGKSTVVKALMLVLNYLKSGRIDTFVFAEDVLEEVNIVSYERAKNRLAKDDYIRFHHVFGPYEVHITVTGKEGMTTARVQEFILGDGALGMRFTIAPEQRMIKLEAAGTPQEALTAEEEEPLGLAPRIEALKKELRKWSKDKTSKGYIQLNQELEALKRKQAILAKSAPVARIRSGGFSVRSYYRDGVNLEPALRAFISETLSMTAERHKKLPENKGRTAAVLNESYSHYRAAHARGRDLRASMDGFFSQLEQVSRYYLGASSTKQPALFAIRDRNNALAQAIHEYQQLGIKPGETAHRFILQWLKEEDGFEVGDDFEIITRAGEAYEVKVSSHGTKIPLSDKGMGSIQAMLLIFRLACIIHKTEQNKAYRPIVIIEEPELNLHPALQSRLSDLFLDVHDKYGIDFMVETHSEYMVRRTQVLVKEKELGVAPNENPFTILYFDKDKLSTWNMKYRPDGRFENDFGAGFYDVAGNLTLDLL